MYNGQLVTDLWVIKVDSNGCFGDGDCGELTTSTMDIEQKKEQVRLYPNPVRRGDPILIDFDHRKMDNVKYVIRDIHGRYITEGLVDTQKEIETEELPSGVLLISFYGEGSIVETKKVVVW